MCACGRVVTEDVRYSRPRLIFLRFPWESLFFEGFRRYTGAYGSPRGCPRS